MKHDIYVIDENKELMELISGMFKKCDFKFRHVNINISEVEEELRGVPDLIIINEDAIKPDALKLCKAIRCDEDNSKTPIIVISSNRGREHRINIFKSNIEYYIRQPIDLEYLRYTIENITRLLHVNRRVSPLTGLPGNIEIQAELKKRVRGKKPFSVLYFDLDNFKSYNDAYGFTAGDEIIKLISKVISKNIQAEEVCDTFVGHIGGDDFVAVVPECVVYEKMCQSIIAEFDKQIITHFTEEDAKRGYLELPNRKNIVEQFPLTSISIGVVVADEKRFANTLEIGEVGAQVKHLAKTTMGSSYAIDRRQDEEWVESKVSEKKK